MSICSMHSDKENYREIKRSHKVNANSNSAPSQACVRTDDTYLYTLSSDIYICAITNNEFSETRPMLQPLELHFLSSKLSILSSRSTIFSFYLFFCLYAIKIYSDLSATSHLNSITLYFSRYQTSLR